jgi:hypothetical protein
MIQTVGRELTGGARPPAVAEAMAGKFCLREAAETLAKVAARAVRKFADGPAVRPYPPSPYGSGEASRRSRAKSPNN